MITARYDKVENLLTIEFHDHVDTVQAEEFYPKLLKIIPKEVTGFTLLTDLSLLKHMDLEVQTSIKKSMDYLNQQGVAEIIRVIPSTEQDIGFKIMSLFHYSKKVKIMTVPSKAEAEERLTKKKQNRGVESQQ